MTPAMAAPMLRLAAALRKKRPRGATIKMSLVHHASKSPMPTRAGAPGTQAWAWQDFPRQL